MVGSRKSLSNDTGNSGLGSSEITGPLHHL